jgi:hypothetical protein
MQKLAFILDEFVLGSPAQQLLDRFLLGYPLDGEFHRPGCDRVEVHQPGASAPNADLARRIAAHGLIWAEELASAVAEAKGLLLVPKIGAGSDPMIDSAVRQAQPGSALFVCGALGSGVSSARRHVELADSRQLLLTAGGPLSVTWRLPPVDLPLGTKLEQALVIVQGPSPQAESDGLDALLPLLSRRQRGESGVRAVRFRQGDALWASADQGAWSRELMAAAISRSDSPQGDPVKDGRTQDLAGLDMVPKLAREPRGWFIEHQDGLRSVILALDGVVADCNFALRLGDGSVLSAQIYQPPKPAQHQYSQLASVIEAFLWNHTVPWSGERPVLSAGLLEAFHRASQRPGERLETPELS